MYFEFANVLVYVLVSAGFIFGSMTLGKVLRPNNPNPQKLSTYECGEEAIGSAWIQFNVRFYIIALIFLIFDVEIAVLFPWAVIFKKPGTSGSISAAPVAGRDERPDESTPPPHPAPRGPFRGEAEPRPRPGRGQSEGGCA